MSHAKAQRREVGIEDILTQRHEGGSSLCWRRSMTKPSFAGRTKSGRAFRLDRVKARCRGRRRHLCVFVLDFFFFAPSRLWVCFFSRAAVGWLGRSKKVGRALCG